MKRGEYKEGDLFPTLSCGELEILKINKSDNIQVKFLNTGHVRFTTAQNIAKGLVADPLAPIIGGVGFMGVGNYSSRYKKPGGGRGDKNPAYTVWQEMLLRCYSEENHSYYTYGAKGVGVCNDWHNFQNFAQWYEENAVYNGLKTKLQIDKDILSVNSCVYSPLSCVAVPSYINNLVRKHPKSELPMGVHKALNKSKKFGVTIKTDNKASWLGAYCTPEEGHLVWQKSKIIVILETLERYKCEVFYKPSVEKAILEVVKIIELDIIKERATNYFYQNAE